MEYAVAILVKLHANSVSSYSLC
ncbi:hypothetical protein DSM3645_03328 [Blastopirellula marina DSM 3645]|uniref:Uncharacterized protein n=1 Tax=Blastopirellula marina DSM 3645 TaxID=314230 RepID=A3ZVX9_9BACT|nr:hypothetical protein DSM3645_03328 [Blastopirellula marina DSM 3645]